MPPSPVVQSTQAAIAAVHGAAAAWGRVFVSDAAAHSQVEAEADSVATVFEAFQGAYSALPRFRTEPALRRFTEAARELVRALRAVKLPAATTALEEAVAAAGQSAEQAEAALGALTGKAPEPKQAGPEAVQGAVYRLLTDRGYGFVRQDGSTTDVFFNSQAIQGARFADLKPGQPVSFRVVKDPRVPGRMQAIELQLLRVRP